MFSHRSLNEGQLSCNKERNCIPEPPITSFASIHGFVRRLAIQAHTITPLRAYWKQPIRFSSRVGHAREYKIALSRNTEG